MPPLNAAVSSSSMVPARPEQLTDSFLQEMLRHQFPSARVVSFKWKPMNLGVISEVVIITVQLEEDAVADGDTPRRVEKRFVGKFLRPEFPFESMFAVESTFYNEYMPEETGENGVEGTTDFPFAIPKAVFTSTVLIVMECVDAVKTFTCVDGSPMEQIPLLVAKLGRMHARFWDHECDGLASSAGIGSELSGEAKRQKFPGCWEPFLDDIPLSSAEKARLTVVCERLSGKPQQLEETHNLVAKGPSTLIHGDFHIANILLSIDPSNDTTWLLDWATCGKGNPLRDLAFFFIVSVQPDHRRAQETQALEVYHDALHETENASGKPKLSLDELQRQYKACVLNQFLILVVYDSLSKHLAASAKTEKMRVELDKHFREVNHRACLSVLDNFRDEDFALLEPCPA